jgi:acyl-CoA synthetase (AMP-forming)/AMP-acid ligase II
VSVYDWLGDPRADHAIRIATDKNGWDHLSYAALASDAHAVAAELAARGVGHGDTVAIALPGSRDGLAALFGGWAAGCTVCMLPVPSYLSGQAYTAHVAAIVAQARPAVTFADADSAPLLNGVVPVSPVRYRHDAAASGPRAPRAQVAAVQFTSGSTSRPRGIELTWDNIDANIAVIARWAGLTDGDGVATWLPLNHDMGFIGCLLASVAHQADLWLMRPEQFIRDPARWLSCLGPGKASHTAAPPFGYGYAARRLPPEQWAALDLSGWRAAIVGAELIDPGVLRAFAAAAAPAGFDPAAFRPAYGLAESTLAVTAAGVGGPGRVLRPDWQRLNFGEPVTVLEAGTLIPGAGVTGPGIAAQAGPGGGRAAATATGWLTGHGMPLPGDDMGVLITDEEGVALPDGTLGEVVVTGRSVAIGYAGEPPFRGTFPTGDGGFVLDGDLYVLGRMGESLKLRARTVYVEDLEVKARAAAGFDRLAMVSMADRGRPGVAVFAEAAPGAWADRVIEALRADFGPEPEIAILVGPRGLIRRTSSGKPRRGEMWRLWSAGLTSGTRLPTEEAADSVGPVGGLAAVVPAS